MQMSANNQSEVVSILKSDKALKASKEELFGLVFDLFKASSHQGTSKQTDMCVDVLSQLIKVVEEDARARIAERLAALEDAPRQVIQYLAVEPIQIAQPVLCKSPVLLDEDLLLVTRICGTQHMEAIAERKEVSLPVANELMRRGNMDVWERLAGNNGAVLDERSIAFLTKRGKQSSKIQLGLIERPDLPQSVLAHIVAEASDDLRVRLEKIGRQDLLVHLDKVKSTAHQRIMSNAGVLEPTFDIAYREVLRHEKVMPLTAADLLEAAKRHNFPRVCAIFSRLADLSLEEAVHWLSRREIDPAIVAFKALGFSEELVEHLLDLGNWRNVLTESKRRAALHAHKFLNPETAQRIFYSRGSKDTLQSA